MAEHTNANPENIRDFIARTQKTSKYRGVEIPEDTLVDLFLQANQTASNKREAEKIARQKLHNIVAPYLGDPDYLKLTVENLRQNLLENEIDRRNYCVNILNSHASTRERLQILDDFYPRLFNITGKPNRIMDLACGLNPFTLPWVGFSDQMTYFAYDLHKARINFIQLFFDCCYPAAHAIHTDILINPPIQKADVVFLFKEAHRMEQRLKGSTRRLLQKIDAEYILLSLPPVSLTGKRSLLAHNQQLVDEPIQGTNWLVTEVPFVNELVFCIKKN